MPRVSAAEVPEVLGRPRLDFWLVITRIWQPRPLKFPTNIWKEVGSNPKSSGSSFSPSRPSLPTLGSSLGSSPDSNRWQKPSKFARRCFPKKEQGTIRVNSAKQGKGFLLLSDSGPSEAMDVGLDSGPNMADLYMAEASGLKLKRARSPPRTPP